MLEWRRNTRLHKRITETIPSHFSLFHRDSLGHLQVNKSRGLNLRDNACSSSPSSLPLSLSQPLPALSYLLFPCPHLLSPILPSFSLPSSLQLSLSYPWPPLLYPTFPLLHSLPFPNLLSPLLPPLPLPPPPPYSSSTVHFPQLVLPATSLKVNSNGHM